MTRSVPQPVVRFRLVSVVLLSALALCTWPPDRSRWRPPMDRKPGSTRTSCRSETRRKTTYWVVLREQAELSAAAKLDRKGRGRFVVEKLKQTAKTSQSNLKALLHGRGADVTPFWAANVVKVTSDAATLEAVAALRRSPKSRRTASQHPGADGRDHGVDHSGGGVERRQHPRAGRVVGLWHPRRGRRGGQHRYRRCSSTTPPWSTSTAATGAVGGSTTTTTGTTRRSCAVARR